MSIEAELSGGIGSGELKLCLRVTSKREQGNRLTECILKVIVGLCSKLPNWLEKD